MQTNNGALEIFDFPSDECYCALCVNNLSVSSAYVGSFCCVYIVNYHLNREVRSLPSTTNMHGNDKPLDVCPRNIRFFFQNTHEMETRGS